MPHFLMHVMSRARLTAREDGEALVAELSAADPGLAPEVCGAAEPLRHRWARSALKECWDGKSFMWRSARRASSGHVIKRMWEHDTHSYVLLTADPKRVAPAAAAPLLGRLGSRFGADYGFVHLFSEADSGRSGPDDPFASGKRPFLMPTPADLERCLPALFWGNVFGPPYVRMFGADTVRSAPAEVVQELAPETFYLQVTGSVEDLLEDYAGFDARRRAVVEHLSHDAFWDAEVGAGGRYRAPALSAPDGPPRAAPARPAPGAEQVADAVAQLTDYAWDCLREDGAVVPVALAVTRTGETQVIGTDGSGGSRAAVEEGLRVFAAEHPLRLGAVVHDERDRLIVHVEIEGEEPLEISREIVRAAGRLSFGRPDARPVPARLLSS